MAAQKVVKKRRERKNVEKGAAHIRAVGIAKFIGQSKLCQICAADRSQLCTLQVKRIHNVFCESFPVIVFQHRQGNGAVAGGCTVILSDGVHTILENFQNEDGTVTIPEVLRPFMGTDIIK